MLADRGATGGEQDVGFGLSGLPNARDDVFDTVLGDAEFQNLGGFGSGEGRERLAAGMNDLPFLELRARRHEFIAGAENSDARRPVHIE